MFWPNFIAWYLIVLGIGLGLITAVVAMKTKPTIENEKNNEKGGS